MSAGGNDNTNDDSDNMVFDQKDAKIFAFVVTLSAKNNPKLSKLLSKGFKKSVYWNEYKTKKEKNNK